MKNIELKWQGIPEEVVYATKLGNQIKYVNQYVCHVQHGHYWIGIELYLNASGHPISNPAIRVKDINNSIIQQEFKTPKDASDFVEQLETERCLKNYTTILQLINAAKDENEDSSTENVKNSIPNKFSKTHNHGL